MVTGSLIKIVITLVGLLWTIGLLIVTVIEFLIASK
jgi:hypothetical protein